MKVVEYAQNYVVLEHNKLLSCSKLSVFQHKLLFILLQGTNTDSKDTTCDVNEVKISEVPT